MEIREEKEWENVQQFNTGPPMTILQAKLLALLGQAHDMFSRIFRMRIYEFFLPNIMYIFVLIFSKLRKTRSKVLRS